MKGSSFARHLRAVAATALLLAALPAAAAPNESPGGGGHMQRMADELGLSSEQRQQLKQIMQGGRNEGEALRNALRQNHEALRALDPAAADYRKQSERLAGESGELARKMALHHAEQRAKVHAILTPEQRVKERNMRPEPMGGPGAEGMAGDRRGHGPMGGSGRP